MFTDNVVRSLSCKARANAMQYVILSAIVSPPPILTVAPLVPLGSAFPSYCRCCGGRRAVGMAGAVMCVRRPWYDRVTAAVHRPFARGGGFSFFCLPFQGAGQGISGCRCHCAHS